MSEEVKNLPAVLSEMPLQNCTKSSKCLIREKLVADTPEERVRQALLRKMIGELGFPKGLISVERAIEGRRYDIVCYSTDMSPLVIIECKATNLNEAAVQQAFGYNATVKAPFICLVTSTEIKTFWQERGKISSVSFLPMYTELYEISRRL